MDKLELAIIGVMMAEPACVPEVAAQIRTTDFARREVGQLFGAMVVLHSGGKPIGDTVFVRSALSDLIGDKPNQVSETELRDALIDADPSSIDHYCDQLRERSQRAALLKLSHRLTQRIETNAPPEKVIADVQVQLDEIRNRLLDGGLEEDIHIAMRDVVLDLQVEPEERVDTRLPTGFPSLDSMIYGVPVPSLWLFGAGTSRGKTAFAMQIARKAAIDGRSVYAFSLEMEWTELAQRLQSMSAGISMDVWSNVDGIPQSVRNEIVSAGLESAKRAEQWKFKVNRESHYDIESICRRARAQAASSDGLDFLIIDYLALIESTDSYDVRNRFNATMMTLKRLSKELKCCVMILAQLSEEGIRDRLLNNKVWAESRYIVHDASFVQIMHDTDDDSTRTLWTVKNRGGEKNFGIELKIDYKFQTFTEVTGNVIRPQ